jgi:CheY-like chemotaxis protein
LGLPDGTGYEFMKEIRERYGLKGIALSGYGMEEDQKRSREAAFSNTSSSRWTSISSRR